jgi:hypothetical protein
VAAALDLFLQGADSDVRDPTMEKMMAAIVATTRRIAERQR